MHCGSDQILLTFAYFPMNISSIPIMNILTQSIDCISIFEVGLKALNVSVYIRTNENACTDVMIYSIIQSTLLEILK